MVTWDEVTHMTPEELDQDYPPAPLPRMHSVGGLYDYAKGAEEVQRKLRVTLSIGDLAAIIYHAEANGVRDISNKHNAVLAEMRQRADACRYHNMAHAVIGEPGRYADIIYDPRYSEDYSDWDIKVIIEEAK